jgi:hypothetical protein
MKSQYDIIFRSVIDRINVSILSRFPLQYAAPIIDPMLVPAIKAGLIPASSKARSTPMCDSPRADPAPSANPIFFVMMCFYRL